MFYEHISFISICCQQVYACFRKKEAVRRNGRYHSYGQLCISMISVFLFRFCKDFIQPGIRQFLRKLLFRFIQSFHNVVQRLILSCHGHHLRPWAIIAFPFPHTRLYFSEKNCLSHVHAVFFLYNTGMIKYNWHTHTSRCGHACGSDEEYVKAAIKAGVKVLGFSDHAAYRTPFPGERMNYDQVPDYIQSIAALKRKYQNYIELHLGMEVECYRSEWETLKQYRQNMEYLILGQHNLDIDENSSYDIRDREHLMAYCDRIDYACAHRLAEYICHPDVCLWSYPKIDGSVKEAAELISRTALKYDIPVELNCGSGVKDYGYHSYEDGERYAYPARAFFEVFAKNQNKVIIGMDIHDPMLFLTDKYLNRALKIVEGLDLNIIENYDILASAAKHRQEFF